MKCCICGKEIKGYGNNPWGALNKNDELIAFDEDDRCCDECNEQYVIPGRLYLIYSKREKYLMNNL